MWSGKLNIQPWHDLTSKDVDDLEDRLYAVNAGRTGRSDGAPLAFRAQTDEGLAGAVAGWTWAGVCEIQQLWVDEAFRGRGLGADLMAQVVAEARARGCAHIFLATYDFQAPAFYEKQGFRCVAEIHDKPVGHVEFVMRLSLQETSGD